MPKYNYLIIFVCFFTTINVTSFADDFVPLVDVYPGMQCYSYTSFSGDDLERMDVTIIGIVEGITPDASIILANVDSPTVQRGGIMSGMSGSPVYYGDKLVGAMSLAYPFAREAICGITPVEAIRKLDELASGPNRTTQYRPRGDLVSQSKSSSGFDLHPIGLSVQTNGMAYVNQTPLFDTPVFRLMNTPGTMLQSGKQFNEIPKIQPGSPMGIGLVTGDVSMVAHGTVTDVIDDKIYAFGHRMFGLGECLLPMHASRVVSIIPSLYISYKLSNTGPAIGAMTFDSEAGVKGELGKTAPTVPVEIILEGFTPEPASYQINVADNEHLTTGLILQSVYGLIDHMGGIQGDLSMEVNMHMELTNGLSLHTNDFYGSVNHAIRVLNNSLRVFESIHQNPLKPIQFKHVLIHCKLAQTNRIATLDAVSVAQRSYKPGESIRVQLQFHGDRIESFLRTVNLPVPQSLPPGRYLLKIMDSAAYQRDVSASQFPAHHHKSFEQWLETLNNRLAGNQVFVALTASGNDIHAHGAVLPSAPAVIQGLLTMPGVEHGAVRSSRVVSSETLNFDVEVLGAKYIPVYVNRQPERQR